ncbi:MAG: hypothetical protein QNJ97_15370 [Myxococcota bacterium]|nr:hypothetical protein [Myxococcota bacterium]
MIRAIQTVGLIAVSVFAFKGRAQELPADCPTRPVDEDVARKIAGDWFSKGTERFDAGDHNAALANFLCSNSIVAHPATLYNAAQAASYAGRRDRALHLAERCADQDPDGISGQMARELMAELAATMPGPEAEPSETTSAEITTDADDAQAPGAPETPEASGVEIDPLPASTKADLEAGLSATPSPSKADTRKKQDTPSLAIPGYVSLTLSGVAMVIGVTLQGITAAMYSDSRETDDPAVFREKRNTGEATQKAAIASFAMSGLTLGTGIVFLILENKNKHKTSDTSNTSAFFLLPAPGGLGIGGRF